MKPPRITTRGQVLAAACFVVTTVTQFFVVTHGTGKLFVNDRPESAIYDSLLENFFTDFGHVDPAVTYREGSIVGKRNVVYYGLLPAVLRSPLHMLFPSLKPLWSRSLCFLAGIMSTIAAALSVRRALLGNNLLSPQMRAALLCLFVLGWGLASPVIILLASSAIWHEAILWGICFASWALFFWCKTDRTPKTYTGFSICSILALGSRLIFAIPLFLLAACESARLLRGIIREPRAGSSQRLLVSSLMALLVPLLIAGGLQGAYNYRRFGSPLVSIMNSEVRKPFTWSDPFRLRAIVSISRLPRGLWNYLGLPGSTFKSEFPYVVVHAAVPRSSETREAALSLTRICPWLLVLTLYGLCVADGGARRPAFLALAIQPFIVCCFAYVSARYVGDFVPLLLFGCLIAFERLRLNWPMFGALSALVLFSSFTTLTWTYGWINLHNNWFLAPEDREMTKGLATTLQRE